MNSNTDRDLIDHALTLQSRRELKISGVRQIISFDECNISLVTAGGELDIDGEGMNIDALDLEKGLASVTGNITGLYYVADQPIKKRWLRRGL